MVNKSVNWQRTTRQRPWLFLVGVGLWLTFLSPPFARAVDEETAKTIADLKSQVQTLMEEVQKLKSQVTSGNPTPPTPPPPPPRVPGLYPISLREPRTPTPPIPDTAEQPTMEQNQGGTTETTPLATQEAQRYPMVDVSEKGLIFRSSDNAHSIRLGGLLQFDDREFVNAPTSQESKFLIRRARPYTSGYFFHDWEYRFAPEFALSAPNSTSYQTTIADAMINYDPIEEIQVQAGKFKPPVSLEQLAPDEYLAFAERSLASNLAPSRDIGVMTHGEIFEGKLSWAAMVGAGSRNNSLSTGLDYDTGPDGYFRLFAQPFLGEADLPEALHGLHFGVGGSISWQGQSSAGTAQLFQNYSTDGGNTFLTFPNGLNVQGEHWRIAPQLYYTYGPFEIVSEFIAEKQGVNTAGVGPGGGFTNYETTAWNVTMSYVLTGDKNTLDGIVPAHPLNFESGDIGAWELAWRYDGIAIGANMFRPIDQGGLGVSAVNNATAANGFSLGLNWYPNRIFRLGVTVEYQDFTGGGGKDTVAENSELGFITRLQLKY